MIIRHIYLGDLPVRRVYQNRKLIWVDGMLISAKAFSFISSYATAEATLWVLLPVQAAGEISFHTDAVMNFLTLFPVLGTSTSNLNGKAPLIPAPRVIDGGLAQTDAFGVASPRLNPPEIIHANATIFLFGFGMSNAFPTTLLQAEGEIFSFEEGTGYAFDAVFGSGSAKVPAVKFDGTGRAFDAILGSGLAEVPAVKFDGTGYAFDAILGVGLAKVPTVKFDGPGYAFPSKRGKGEVVSQSDTLAIALSVILRAVESNAISQTDIIGIARDQLAVHSLALQSSWSNIMGAGHAVDALPMNGNSSFTTSVGAHAILAAIDAILKEGAAVSHVRGVAGVHSSEALRIQLSAESVTRLQGNILPTSAVVVAGGSISENIGKGTMKVWHLPILNGDTLKIRQAYDSYITDGKLSVT